MKRHDTGFTFIEVMVATLLFVMAVLASVNLTKGSVRATLDAKQMSIATWLLQRSMVELETKLESEGIEKGCEKKKEGKFEAPYEQFTWVRYCDEIDFNLSQTALSIAQSEKKEDDTKEDMILKMLLKVASDYISKSIRELHTEVRWMDGKNKKTVSVTTHFARYDQPFTLPSMGGATP